MTKEDAANELKKICDGDSDVLREAKDVAIECLEARIRFEHLMRRAYHYTYKSEYHDDNISRESAKEAFEDWWLSSEPKYTDATAYMFMRLDALPSVTS